MYSTAINSMIVHDEAKHYFYFYFVCFHETIYYCNNNCKRDPRRIMINICLEKLKHVQKFLHKDSLRLFVNIVHRFGDFYIGAAYLVVISANLMITLLFKDVPNQLKMNTCLDNRHLHNISQRIHKNIIFNTIV